MMTTAELAEKLAAYGIDYADAMDRFGDNSDLYERLAFKYLDDAHFVNMQAALEVKDFDEAYKEAHALKGVAGNLSLAELYQQASAICTDLLQGDSQAAETLLPAVNEAHIRAIEGLEAWRDGTM